MTRKKPFSGKAKKQQLQAKRERKNQAVREDDRCDENGDDNTRAAATPTQANTVPASMNNKRGDLRTIFQLEPQAVIDARKKDATRALVYAADRGHSQSIYTYGIHDPSNQPRILMKPTWTREMSTEELIEAENVAYTEWLADLKQEEVQRADGAKCNLYERNIEVWRQLWRVIERSSVLIHLADARCPLLHISDRLMGYVRTTFPFKKFVLVLTKADLVATERVKEWVEYLQQRYGCDVPVLAYSREDTEKSNAMLMRTIGQVSAAIDPSAWSEAYDNEKEILTVGFVGEPNVGKSSLLNSLFDRKLVSVSATPGHTKHLQTHFFDRVDLLERGDEFKRVLMFDCPGVVFPRLNVPLALQILFGSFPIAQTREPFSAVRFIAENCLPPLQELYKLQPVDEDDDEQEWSPYTLCEAFAKLRGFRVKGGKLDVHRAANLFLRDTLNGKKVVLSFPPIAS